MAGFATYHEELHVQRRLVLQGLGFLPAVEPAPPAAHGCKEDVLGAGLNAQD